MLGYETHRAGEMGDFSPFSLQGLQMGNYPPYPMTSQPMGMAPPPWNMLTSGGGIGQGPLPSPMMIPGTNCNAVSPASGGDPAPLSTETSHSSLGHPYSEQAKCIPNPTPVSPPPTRERFSYTRYQLELLSGIYGKIRYPNSMQKQLISKRVGITRDQVKIWFQNRRRKDIVGKKPTGVELNPDGKHMVPETVMASVLSELLSYENNPKGKVAIKAQKSYAKKVAKKRTRDDSESTDTEAASKRYKPCQDNAQDVPIYYTNETSPVSFDSFSSSAASPYSSSSQHESEATSVKNPSSVASPNTTTDIPAHLMTASVADPANNTVEVMFYPPPYTISSEQLDKPSPPNRIAPGVCLNPNLPQRPPSLESPALDPGVENSTTSTDDGLQLNQSSVSDDGTKPQPEKRHISPKDVPPNRIAPPSEPIKFNPKIAAPHHIVPTVHIPVVSSKGQMQPGQLPMASPSSDSSSHSGVVATTSATPIPIQSFTPLYAPDAEHFSWHKMSLPVTSPEKPQQPPQPHAYTDLNMFFPPPPHPYGGPPGVYPDFGGNNFDKIMPYMMSGFPGFPSPYDPGLFGKTLNNNNKETENNNISGILKDAYPPAFMIPQYHKYNTPYSESLPTPSVTSDKVTYL